MTIHEMRPVRATALHKTDGLAELVWRDLDGALAFTVRSSGVLASRYQLWMVVSISMTMVPADTVMCG